MTIYVVVGDETPTLEFEIPFKHVLHEFIVGERYSFVFRPALRVRPIVYRPAWLLAATDVAGVVLYHDRLCDPAGDPEWTVIGEASAAT